MIVFLKFTATQAKAVARMFNKLPDNDPKGDRFDPDGWYAVQDGTQYYYNFDVCFGDGVVWSTFSTGSAMRPGPGGSLVLTPIYTSRGPYHVNLRWEGPEDSLPPALASYRVFPVHPAVLFG